MPILTLKFEGNHIKTFDLSDGKTCSIGRRESNDIVITHLTVSGDHARVECTPDGYLLADLQSKNKTYVNGEQVDGWYLQQGDEILIGKHTLSFELSESDYALGIPGIGTNQTIAIDADTRHEMMSGAKKSSQDRVGVLIHMDDGKQRVVLRKKLTQIGRDSLNDIVVEKFMVGKVAATISKSPAGYSLNYMGGRARVKVNNNVVKDSVLLDEYDSITLSGVEFQFYYI